MLATKLCPGGLSKDRVRRIVAQIGTKAGVIVDEKTGKPATAHDYRRAFGTRWAKRVMPVTLKALMRHRDISTTLQFYVDQNAEDVAADLWVAYKKVQAGNTLGNTSPDNAVLPGVLGP